MTRVRYYIHKLVLDPKDDYFDAAVAALRRFDFQIYPAGWSDVKKPTKSTKPKEIKIYSGKAIFKNYSVGCKRARLYYRAWTRANMALSAFSLIGRVEPDLWQKNRAEVSGIVQTLEAIWRVYATPESIKRYGHAVPWPGAYRAVLWNYRRIRDAIKVALRATPRLSKEALDRLRRRFDELVSCTTFDCWYKEHGLPCSVVDVPLNPDTVLDWWPSEIRVDLDVQPLLPSPPVLAEAPAPNPDWMSGTAFHRAYVKFTKTLNKIALKVWREYSEVAIPVVHVRQPVLDDELKRRIKEAKLITTPWGTRCPFCGTFAANLLENEYARLAAYILDSIYSWQAGPVSPLADWISEHNVPTVFIARDIRQEMLRRRKEYLKAKEEYLRARAEYLKWVRYLKRDRAALKEAEWHKREAFRKYQRAAREYRRAWSKLRPVWRSLQTLRQHLKRERADRRKYWQEMRRIWEEIRKVWQEIRHCEDPQRRAELSNEYHQLRRKYQRVKTLYQYAKEAFYQDLEELREVREEYVELKRRLDEIKRKYVEAKREYHRAKLDYQLARENFGQTVQSFKEVRAEYQAAKRRKNEALKRYRDSIRNYRAALHGLVTAKRALVHGLKQMSAAYRNWRRQVKLLKRRALHAFYLAIRGLSKFANAVTKRARHWAYWRKFCIVTAYNIGNRHMLHALDYVERSEALRKAYEHVIRRKKKVKVMPKVYAIKPFKPGTMEDFYRKKFAQVLFIATLSTHFLKFEKDPNNFERWSFTIEPDPEYPVYTPRFRLTSDDWLRRYYLGDASIKRVVQAEKLAIKGVAPPRLRFWEVHWECIDDVIQTSLNGILKRWQNSLLDRVGFATSVSPDKIDDHPRAGSAELGLWTFLKRVKLSWKANPLTDLPVPEVQGEYLIGKGR